MINDHEQLIEILEEQLLYEPKKYWIPATRRRRRSHRRGSAILKPIGGRWSTSSSGTLTNCQTRSSRPTRRSSTSGMSSGSRIRPGDRVRRGRRHRAAAKEAAAPRQVSPPSPVAEAQAQDPWLSPVLPGTAGCRHGSGSQGAPGKDDGKTKQFKPTAEEIVADIWGVTVAEVKRGLNRIKRENARRKNILKRKKITRLGKRRSPAKQGLEAPPEKNRFPDRLTKNP